MKVLLSILLLCFGVILQGCVAIQSFPKIARNGDTITLAVGTPDSMTKTNTTAQFVSDSDPYNPINLPIRSIIKIQPDNTSFLANFHFTASYISPNTSHSPWLAVVVLDLPTNLPLGTGHVNITTQGIINYGPNVNNIQIKLEIIPGVGSVSSFAYDAGFAGVQQLGDLTLLEPLPQVVIKPPVTGGALHTNIYGAVQIIINVPTQKTGGGGVVIPGDLRIVQDDMYPANSRTQTQMNWSKTGENITINFLSPTGMKFFQTRASIILKPGNEFIQMPGPSLTSVTFYDLNGNVVTDGVPLVSDFEIVLE